MKRFTALALCVLICLTALPVCVSAAAPAFTKSVSAQTGAVTFTLTSGCRDSQGLYYTLNPSSRTAVVGSTYFTPASQTCEPNTDVIVIPDNVVYGNTTYTVNAIGKNALSSTDVRRVSVCASVLTVGEFAFAGCRSLETVSLAGVRTVNGFAFWSCPRLTAVSFGATVSKIGGGAFKNCPSLKTVTLPSSSSTQIKKYAFTGTGLTKVYYSGSKPTAASGALGNASLSSLSSAKVESGCFYAEPGDTVEIPFVLSGSSGHTKPSSVSVTTDLTVTDILPGDCANASVSSGSSSVSLSSVSGDGVLFILKVSVPANASGTYSVGCATVTVCSHTSTETVVLKAAECDAAGLSATACTVCGKLLAEYATAPAGHSGSEYTVTATCTTPGFVCVVCDNCPVNYFYDEVPVPGHVYTNYSDKTCNVCGRTRTLEFIATGTRLDKYQGKDVAVVTVPEDIKTIGAGAFANHTELTAVVYPPNLTSLSTGVFSGCTGLTDFALPSVITEIPANTFYECTSLTSVSGTDNVTSIGTNAFSRCSSLVSYALPAGTVTLGNYAFAKCDSLESVAFPSALRTVGNSAFAECPALETVVLPDGVASIGNNAFSYCAALTDVYVPDSVLSIGTDAFAWSPDVLLHCAAGSYAQSYAEENNIPYVITCTHAPDGAWVYDGEYHHQTCTLCGNGTLYAAHDFDDDCDTTCDVCGYVRTATHVLVPTVVAPTCTEDGYTRLSCPLCGYSETTNVVPASGHVYDNELDMECNVCGEERIIERENEFYVSVKADKKICLPGDVITLTFKLEYSGVDPDEVGYCEIVDEYIAGIRTLSAMETSLSLPVGFTLNSKPVLSSLDGIVNAEYADVSVSGMKGARIARMSVQSYFDFYEDEDFIRSYGLYGTGELFTVSVKVGDSARGQYTLTPTFNWLDLNETDAVVNFSAPTVTVRDPNATVTSLRIASKPTKLTYTHTDTLDLDGLVLTVGYSDGITESITDGYTVSDVDFTTAGIKVIQVFFGGLSSAFTVNVGHEYIESVTPATCTEDGERRLVCSCGEVYEAETIPATGHVYDGDDDMECNVCGESRAPAYVPGDVNGDGTVSSADVNLLMRYIAGYSVVINEAAADANGDGTVSSSDANLLQRFIAGYNVTLG